jgi:hypothetical protein
MIGAEDMRRDITVFSDSLQRAQQAGVLRGRGTTGLLNPSVLAS